MSTKETPLRYLRRRGVEMGYDRGGDKIVEAVDALDWQPIETHDGSFVTLLYQPGFGQFVGGRDGYGWYIRGDETQYYELGLLKPTHWKPLDEPPGE